MADDVPGEWIDSQARFDDIVADLTSRPAYALDTEFHRERTYWPQLALVQLAWRDGVALIDPLAVDMSGLSVLLDSDAVCVAHAADQDLEILQTVCGVLPRQLFDTQVAAGFLGYSSPSLSTLALSLVKVTLPKGDRMTDWTRRPLDPAQRRYAASDVTHLLDLHEQLRAELDRRGRLAWAEQECEALRVRPRGPGEPDVAWWRVKDVRHIRGAGRGVAQALAAWRERRAAALDRPVRFILSDMAILTISSNPPGSLDALKALRGVDGRQVGGGAGKEILAAVATGQALTTEQLRLPSTDELDRRMRPAVALAAAWVAQLAVDLHIDAALLATRADLHALLNDDPDSRLATGWRNDVVGEPVRRLATGDAALAFDGKGGLVLVPRS
ncbi:MAG: rnd [Acidimicrobiales bacterium]|nr:rnd [Acidimicrobiales bacterium]